MAHWRPSMIVRDRARSQQSRRQAWLVSLACDKAKDHGYPHELWTTRLLARHAREHGPVAGHACLASLVQGGVQDPRPSSRQVGLYRRDRRLDQNGAALRPFETRPTLSRRGPARLTTTFTAALRCSALTAPMTLDGPMRSRSASCADSASIAGSTTPSDCAAKSPLGNGRGMLHALASNGCSRQTRPAPKWAEPIPTLPKSHNHCAEVLVQRFPGLNHIRRPRRVCTKCG